MRRGDNPPDYITFRESVINLLMHQDYGDHARMPVIQFFYDRSIFKNPPGEYAAKLIEKVGLKGKRIGGAVISPKHANFIVNTGDASANDILSLMNVVREKVKEATGIELEPEIRVTGR
jgi:UDP-N-acetylenolpyruvoylglucosamine reductase